MRSSRLEKFRKKNRSIFIVLQLVAICFLSLYGIGQITSPTTAKFSDVDQVSFSMAAGEEFPSDPGDETPNEPEDPDPDEPEDPNDDGSWDKSSLKFKGEGVRCERDEIFAVIENGKDSRDMLGPVTYEVYWIAKGNPKPDKGGTLVESGQVPALQSGNTFEMTFKPTKSGNYMFRAEQRPGHPGKGELWSDAITIESNCITSLKTPKKESNKPLENSDHDKDSEKDQETNDKTEEIDKDMKKAVDQKQEGKHEQEVQQKQENNEKQEVQQVQEPLQKTE